MSTDLPPLILYILFGIAISLLASSMIIVAGIRYVANRNDVILEFSGLKLFVASVLSQTVTLALGSLALLVLHGIPAGPLVGPPLAFLVAVYALPLFVGAVILSVVVRWATQGRSNQLRRSVVGVVFAAGHAAAVPVAWVIVIVLWNFL